MVWTSVPSILIGKHQNTFSEINVPYVEENQIPVVRRMSGGGTVFCDRGNMNFTFIEDNLSGFIDFIKFTKPILEYLNTLNVPAEFSGRNDLVIEGKKFSGNAQYKIRNCVVHHGTLLFDASLSHLSNALTPKKEKFIDKSVKSVASRVTNIASHMDQIMTVESFREGLYAYIKNSTPDSEYYELTMEDIDEIQVLVDSKYETWDWNFGKSPKYTYVQSGKFLGGFVEIGMDVSQGIITRIKLQGDFFGNQPIEDLEVAITGLKHNIRDMTELLSHIELDQYMHRISPADLCSLMFDYGSNPTL
jgi:lipoate-protein ligase A